jgi:hypothetical protein|tara:strand:- start:261 stop:599 length:339 start_codon:yes stop_codon:yes gene_type:complete
MIDINEPIEVYKVLMSEVSGYFIDVAASSPEEAMHYAEINKKSGMYKPYDKEVVDISPVEVVTLLECGGCLAMFTQHNEQTNLCFKCFEDSINFKDVEDDYEYPLEDNVKDL